LSEKAVSLQEHVDDASVDSYGSRAVSHSPAESGILKNDGRTIWVSVCHATRFTLYGPFSQVSALGLLSAAICTWSSSLANAALFALVFPVVRSSIRIRFPFYNDHTSQYVIMAMHARPVPRDPYNPIPPAQDKTIRHPSPFIPIRLPIFAIVIWLNEWLVWLLSVGGPRETTSAGHRRRMSDAVESVEEGEVVELRTVQGTWREATVGGTGKRAYTI
jgi:hypothetical protein